MALGSAFAQEPNAAALPAAGAAATAAPAEPSANPGPGPVPVPRAVPGALPGNVPNAPAGASASVSPAANPGAAQPPMDATALGKALLNAGPDARVNLDGLSRDHAAILGTDDPDEQAVLDQERALQAQRDQLKVLERVLNAPPPNMDPNPPAMIPLHPGAPMNMPRLAPTPSGSELDHGNSATRRSIDEMQRRVNALRRDADTLKQGGR